MNTMNSISLKAWFIIIWNGLPLAYPGYPTISVIVLEVFSFSKGSKE